MRNNSSRCGYTRPKPRLVIMKTKEGLIGLTTKYRPSQDPAGAYYCNGMLLLLFENFKDKANKKETSRSKKDRQKTVDQFL